MNRVNNYLIQGIRRSTGNQYVNYEAVVHPEVGFPGGGLQPFLGETFGTYFGRMGKLVKRLLGTELEVIGVHDTKILGEYIKDKDKIQMFLQHRYGDGNWATPRKLVDIVIDPKNQMDREVVSTLRHELGHVVQTKYNTPVTLTEVKFGKEFRALSEEEQDIFVNNFMKQGNKIQNIHYGLHTDRYESVAHMEIITEATAIKSSAEVYRDIAYYNSAGYSISPERARIFAKGLQPLYFDFKPSYAAEGLVIGPQGAAVVSNKTMGIGTELHRIATGNIKTSRSAKVCRGPTNSTHGSRAGRYRP